MARSSDSREFVVNGIKFVWGIEGTLFSCTVEGEDIKAASFDLLKKKVKELTADLKRTNATLKPMPVVLIEKWADKEEWKRGHVVKASKSSNGRYYIKAVFESGEDVNDYKYDIYADMRDSAVRKLFKLRKLVDEAQSKLEEFEGKAKLSSNDSTVVAAFNDFQTCDRIK